MAALRSLQKTTVVPTKPATFPPTPGKIISKPRAFPRSTLFLDSELSWVVQLLPKNATMPPDREQDNITNIHQLVMCTTQLVLVPKQWPSSATTFSLEPKCTCFFLEPNTVCVQLCEFCDDLARLARISSGLRHHLLLNIKSNNWGHECVNSNPQTTKERVDV